MRHLKSYRKLGKESSHRRAMLRNMATSFLQHGKIYTTVPRAKELRPIVEKMITLGKKGTLHGRRQMESYLFGRDAGHYVCHTLAPRYADRKGGYTRIVKFGPRFGDGADMCNLELVDYREQEGKVALGKKQELKAKKQKEAEEEATKAAAQPVG